MKKTILILTICLLGIAACTEKEDTRPECEKNSTGTFTITNENEDPYSVSFNGKDTRIVNPGSSFTQSFNHGSYTIDLVQADGYILTPTRLDVVRYLDICGTETVTLSK